MIKIAFIIDTIESPTAGTEKQLLLLIKHLDRSRFQPYLCVLRSTEWLENEFDTCPIFVAGINSFKSLSSLINGLALVRFLKAERIDIVQTHFRDSSIAGILAAAKAGIRTIIGTRRNQGYWMTPLDLKIQKWLDRWVSVYIANSESTKQWLNDTEGVDSKRVSVICNGFDLSLFPPKSVESKIQMRQSLGITESASVVVIVANLRPVKDHVTFLKAACVVHTALPDCHFVIVGTGSEVRALQTLSAELGITSNTHFLGARQDIPDILSACDIGVLSSLSESFSNALVEYMAAGLPVVTTDVGGAREAVLDGINGFIVAVGDWESMGNCILTIISDRCKGMGLESRRLSNEHFSLAKMVENTERLYASFC